MDRTGNIAALSLTFAAGVAAGSIFVAQIMAWYLSPGGLYAILTCLFIVTLTILTAARLSRRGGLWKILILFLFTGIFCAVCSFVSGIGAGSAGSGGIAARCADNVRSMLDSIPFPSPRTSPLLKALLTGDKSGLDSHTVTTFRDSGAAHILALSGLHLGFIYAILLKVTSLAGMSPRVRKIRSILIIAVSGFYTIATGASPSLVRAFLFIVINETARLMHRHVPPVHVLCIALMIQLGGIFRRFGVAVAGDKEDICLLWLIAQKDEARDVVDPFKHGVEPFRPAGRRACRRRKRCAQPETGTAGR